VNGVTTQYLVEDDVNPTGLPQVVEETVNGAVTRSYTYGLERISEAQPINGAWTPSFYEYDGAGSVRQLTNLAANVTVTDTYEYDAFGNAVNKTGATPNNYLYRGEQYDPDLGLYYLRARYYNPATGRFLSRDPEDGISNNPATLHKYLYVGGDPVNGIDPLGWEDIIEYKAQSKASGLQSHHIIEQRFAKTLGAFYCTISAVLTIEEHQAVTNAWRRAIPYGAGGTGVATIAEVFSVAEQIYANAPNMLAAAQKCQALAGL
jgi:RHS repeat-associated protein